MAGHELINFLMGRKSASYPYFISPPATAAYVILSTFESLLFESNLSERCQHCGNLNPKPPTCFPAETQMAGQCTADYISQTAFVFT